jgi:hypothetical protein
VVEAGSDVSFCTFPASTQLNANIFGDYLGFAWTPLTAENTLEPFVSPAQPTFYLLSATAADLDHNLVVNGDFEQYAWATTDGHIDSGDNLMHCVVSQIGFYFLTVTNTNTGCTAAATIEVTDNTTLPLAFAQVNDTLTCDRDTTILLSTGSATGANISYAWKNTGGQVVGLDATCGVGTAGVYVLQVTNTNTNCVEFDTVTVVENRVPPTILLPTGLQITCSADTIQLTLGISPPSLPLLVQWSANEGGHFVSGSDTPIHR